MRLAHDLRPYGIPLDVSSRREQVIVVHDELCEPALPEVTAPAFAKIDVPRIATMSLADRPG